MYVHQRSRREKRSSLRIIIPLLLILVVGACNIFISRSRNILPLLFLQDMSTSSTKTASNASDNPLYFQDPMNPLAIPKGQAPNLPSITIDDKNLNKKRRGYGGVGDKQHLGGFSEMDVGGINPGTFKHMVEKLGVKSLLDVGCGRGFSTSWFVTHGVDAMCVEGSHDAVERTVIPDSESRLVEHDFSRGPWWPSKTFDAAWSVEFLEHVPVQYQFNYISAFRKAALLFVTASTNFGWHHVEVHKSDWWIRKYESYGFRYDAKLSEQVRNVAKATKKDYQAPNGQYFDGFYIRVNMMVFVNPIVAALPQHAHLFPEPGCIGKGESKFNRPCRADYGETEAPDFMLPITLTKEMDDVWLDIIKMNVKGMADSPKQ
jgi:hypothetical protein